MASGAPGLMVSGLGLRPYRVYGFSCVEEGARRGLRAVFIALIRFQWVLVAYSLELQGQIEKLLDNYRIAANVTGVSWAICSIIPCYKQEVPQERNYIKIMRPSVWFRTYP